jgi:hypothetical protein
VDDNHLLNLLRMIAYASTIARNLAISARKVRRR